MNIFKIILISAFLLISNFIFAENSSEVILSKMSLNEKINQLFIFNVHKPVMDKSFRTALKSHHPGSYILFGKDILSAKSLYNLTHKLQRQYKKLNLLPALIMIDQEGGHVTRINTRPNLPSPLSVSTAGSPALSYKVGAETSNILKVLGVNVNLAPVVDLSDPNKYNFIGNRSFGNNPQTVTQYASTQAMALEENSIIPTFKHFPGHGGVVQDSHKGLPEKMSTLEELKNHDLLPYKTLIKQHPGAAILVGHIAFPKIDKSGVPATFSKLLLTDVLKKEMGFKGLIITDDLQMHALKDFGSLKERSKLAFNAGSDLLMVTGSYKTQSRLLRNFRKLVNNKSISMDRINESVLKVIQAKLKIQKNFTENIISYKEAVPKIKASVAILKKNSDQIISNNFQHSMSSIMPILKKELSSINRIKVYSAHGSFYRQVKRYFPNKKFNLQYLRKSKGKSKSFRGLASKNGLNIFYVTGMGTLRMLNKLPKSTKSKTIVINSTHPGAIKNSGFYKNVVNVNTPYVYSGKLFSKILQE